MLSVLRSAAVAAAFLAFGSQAHAAEKCPATQDQLTAAVKAAVQPAGGPSNGGLDNHMWAVLTGRDGVICAVAFSGQKWSDQWLGSRVIAAQKAYTANAFSLNKAAMSTANMYAGSQPGGFLFGIQASNPANPESAYDDEAAKFGTASDPMIGEVVGGIIVFGGGLGLYNGEGLIGGLGLSGDTSCADHNVAWRVRKSLGLDKVPAGPAPALLKTDGIIYDIGMTGSTSGFGHPKCAAKEADVAKDIGSSQ